MPRDHPSQPGSLPPRSASGDAPARHREAAEQHDASAARHEKAAAFWGEQGDGERAELQSALAEHERNGAELERRWADLLERDRPRAPRGPEAPTP